MKKLSLKSNNLLSTFSNLEKKHKIITYSSLLFLTVSAYFLRTENQNIKIEYATLKEKNISLKHNMVLFNRTYEEFPLPIWQKVKRGGEFILQYINPQYLKDFGHYKNYDKYAFIGKNNFDLYEKNIAQIYFENDVAVSVTGTVLESIEKYVDKDKNVKQLKIIKWRSINDNKDTLIYGMVKEILPYKN